VKKKGRRKGLSNLEETVSSGRKLLRKGGLQVPPGSLLGKERVRKPPLQNGVTKIEKERSAERSGSKRKVSSKTCYS